MLSLKSILQNKKLFGIIIAILTALTLLFNLVILTTPYLIGYYKTSNGIVEYFSSSDPEFIIKPYLNGSNTPALISVFVNLPNEIAPLEENFTSSLIIPFSKLEPYMEYWLPWAKKENTSLLVIATYFNGTKAYSATEEVEYSPLWIINNEGIQIVAEVNIIGKMIPINWSLVQQVVQKLETNRPNLIRAPPGGGPPGVVSYTINVITKNCSLPTISVIVSSIPYLYAPTLDYVAIKNISVPLSWVTISNDVLSYDKFNNIEVFDALKGEVGFMAISNTSNYGGPYIGPSVSTNVNWSGYINREESALQSLNSPSLYVYYNATLALAVYTVYKVQPVIHGAVKIPIANVTVFEFTWVNPNKAGATVEGYNYLTQVYVNGNFAGYIPGNGTPSLIINFLQNSTKIAASPLGYASWSNGYVNYTSGPIKNGGNGWSFNMLKDVYETSNLLGEVTTGGDIMFDIIDFLVETGQKISALSLGMLFASIILSIVEFFLDQPQVIENFVENSFIAMSAGNNEAGHVYVSYLNYSITNPIPIEGFILNYSNWYYLDK